MIYFTMQLPSWHREHKELHVFSNTVVWTNFSFTTLWSRITLNQCRNKRQNTENY